MKKLLFILSLLVIGGRCYAGTVSFDQLSVSADLTATKYNSDLDRIYQKVNTNVQTDNIANDSLAEADMADEINPRVRTYEGASCEFVYSGLLPTTTSSTLVGSIPAGTAYPRGYRVIKSSPTTKTWTGDCTGTPGDSLEGCWTWVDIDQNGLFTYSEVAINGATPTIATNSIRLAKVSTDTTQVNAVTDLRTLSCASGAFTSLVSGAGEANLDDMFKNGAPMIKRWNDTNQGFQQGLQISWDSATVFRVKAGSIWINGEYRSLSTDITVTTTMGDDPTNGTSGIIGTIGASTKYNIYAVADQSGVKNYSISYGTAPTGLSNYRKIGEIKTDGGSVFTSTDISAVNTILPREQIGGWIILNGSSMATLNSYNVSSTTDNGTGDYLITWDLDFNSANYVVSAVSGYTYPNIGIKAIASGSVEVVAKDFSGNAQDETVYILAIGDK